MKWLNIIWIILLIIYIFSPWDLHPSLFDDMLALAVMLYIWYGKRNLINRGREPKTKVASSSSNEVNSLGKAYQFLQVSPSATLAEIKKAYYKRLAENHPDKVHHLSPELKQRAHELTHQIQTAFTLIKKHRGL